MVETLTVSEIPRWAYLEDWWICVVAPLLASWGFLMSAIQFVPLTRQKHVLPDKHETVLSRYRLHLPEEGEEEEDEEDEETAPQPRPQQSAAPSRTSSNSLGGEPPPEEQSSRKGRRRDSIYSIFGASKKKTTRARSGSDPTGRGPALEAFYERAAQRAKKCMRFAANLATSPTRPVMKRARSVIQKSMAAGNGAIRRMGDLNDDEPKSRRRKLIESTRVRTKRVFKRSGPTSKKDKQANAQAVPDDLTQGREQIAEDPSGSNQQTNAGRPKSPRRRLSLFHGTRHQA